MLEGKALCIYEVDEILPHICGNLLALVPRACSEELLLGGGPNWFTGSREASLLPALTSLGFGGAGRKYYGRSCLLVPRPFRSRSRWHTGLADSFFDR